MKEFIVTLQQELQRIEEESAGVAEELAVVRRQTEERITGLEEKKGQMQARARHIRALLTLEGVASYTENGTGQLSAQESGPDGHEKAPASLADAVYQLLSQAGQEFHYLQLVKVLAERGVEVSGQDPGINLVAHIHNDERFVRPKRGVYALREWYPANMISVGTRKARVKKRRAKKTTAKVRR